MLQRVNKVFSTQSSRYTADIELLSSNLRDKTLNFVCYFVTIQESFAFLLLFSNPNSFGILRFLYFSGLYLS